MSIQRILVLTDFSPCSARALETAVEMARALKAQLQVLHCYDELTGGRAPLGSAGLDPSLRDDALARVKDQVERVGVEGVDVEYEVRPGPNATAVLDAIRKAAPDLLVLGTHGRTGLEHVLLGSIAEKCVREAPCPVVTVKAS